MIINDQLITDSPDPYTGDAEDVRYIIYKLCKSASKKSENCTDFIYNYEKDTPKPTSPSDDNYEDFALLLILFIFFGLSIIFFIAAFLYRRNIERAYED